MIKISIIVPVYNCEKYLEQCIESVLNQTLKELEIICVDDGSTDQSVKVIKKFISLDKRIFLLQQENQGPGIARNVALKNARGKYVAFLDADDYYLEKNALEVMFDTCEKNNIFVCASLKKIFKNKIEEKNELFQDVRKNIILDYQDYQMDYDYQCYLFQREFLIKNKFYFPDYRRFEDPVFLTKVLFKARKFIVADIYLYCYRYPNISARFNTEKTIDLLKGLLENLQFAKEHNLNILFNTTVFRLEIEYCDIIINNVYPGDLCILQLLIQANQIICDLNRNSNYIIKPLHRLLLNMCEYEKKLLEKIKKQDKIYLYGAGWFGQIFLNYLKENNLSEKVDAFIVSDVKKNKDYIEEIPVINLCRLRQVEQNLILVTVIGTIQKEIEGYLKENKYKNYEVIEELFLCKVADELKKSNQSKKYRE